MNLKLFVWRDVLNSYGEGTIVVYAESEEHAWALLKEHENTAWYAINNFDGSGKDLEQHLNSEGKFKTDQAPSPVIIEEPFALAMWGYD